MQLKYTARENKPIAPVTRLSGAGAVLGRPDANDSLIIRVDTREQLPIDFHSDYVKTKRDTITVFDYALEGDQDNFSLERKSLADFVQAVSLSKSWLRELAKITKAKERELPIIYILECNFNDIQTYDYSVFKSGAITSQFIYRRIAQLVYEYNTHVVFAGSREGASYAICLLLKRRKDYLSLKDKHNAQRKT